jgi:hypothetical protein
MASKDSTQSIEQTGKGRQLAAILRAYKRCKTPFRGGRCTGHVAIKLKGGRVDINFSPDLADKLENERTLENEGLSKQYGVPVSQILTARKMVATDTTRLRDLIRFEPVVGTVPKHVIEYYLHAAAGCDRENKVTLLALLQSTMRCCVPAAILYQHLYGGELLVGKLGFSDYDWEFGGEGVAWV